MDETPQVVSTVSLDLNTVTVSADEGAVTATIFLLDEEGEKISGRSFELTTTMGTIGPMTTSADGTSSVQITGLTTAGMFTVQAVHADLLSMMFCTVTPGRVTASTTSFQATPASATADGTSSVRLTLQPKDQYGNALGAERNVRLRTTSATAVITSPVWNDEEGVYEANVTNTQPETVSIVAKVDGVSLSAIEVPFTAQN